MERKNKESTSGEQDVPQTPAGSTTLDKEKLVPQENTDEPVILACKKDPESPGEYRCKPVSKPVVPKAVSSLTMQPSDTPSIRFGEGDSGTPDSNGVEIWSRNNGETMRVRRIECEGRVLFLPIDDTPKPQSEDPQSPMVKTAKQDSSVGRSQLSRCGGGAKGSCKLPGMRSSTRVKQNDQTHGGP